MNNKDVAGFPGGVFTLKVYENRLMYLLGISKQTVRIHNKMTNASLAVITGLLGATGAQTAFGYLAVGSSSTAVSAAHTALQSEISTGGLGRAAATVSRTTTTQTNDTLSFVKVFTASGSNTINEIGIFNASSSGVMLARALTGAISVVTGNVVTGTYTWQAVGN